MDRAAVVAHFDKVCRTEDVAVAIAAIRTQLWVLEEGLQDVSTVTELREVLMQAAEAMATTNTSESEWSVRSGCELFLRFITYTKLLDDPDFSECRRILIERGHQFLQRLNGSRDRIATHFVSIFPKERQTLLLHGRSRMVRHVLETAAATPWCRFRCFVTEARPDLAGRQMCEELRQAGVECDVILDSAVGFVMPRVDLVVLGAEVVVLSGGIVNKLGSLAIAMCATALKKPVWVLAESFKFMKKAPFYQADLPQRLAGPYSAWRPGVPYQQCREESETVPRSDYTKPKFLNTIVTDLGIMDPTGVALATMKLYL